MNINMNMSRSIVQTTGNDEIGVAVLRKAIAYDAQGAKSLIEAIPKPGLVKAENLPPHLGQHINVTA
jgi:hypothetical protein